MKLGSLFDGIGGWPLAAMRHGITPVWGSEIESFPITVTKKHFPDMKHLGDLTKINGAEIELVDVITFGSPCQDLSVAGKRAGMAGERSGLFIEAVRIIREMRDSTDGQYPRFAVWENVPGAFSSNKGDDFRAVLEEIAEAEIPMPKSGKWAQSGMVGGNGVEIAWRVLDAQYWGVPQRRKRIFLVADFGGCCAGEILFKPESVRGDIETCGGEGEGIAGSVEVGVGIPSGIGTDIYNLTTTGNVACIITSSQHKGAGASGPSILVSAIGFKANSSIADNAPVLNECIPPLQVTSQMAVCEPIPINDKATRYKGGGDTRNNDGAGNGCKMAVCFGADLSQKAEGIGFKEEVAACLAPGTHGGHGMHVIEPIPINDKATRYKGGGDSRNNDGSGNGLGVGKPGDPCPTLTACDRHAVAYGTEVNNEITNTLLAKSNLSYRRDMDNIVAQCITTGTGRRYDPETETLIPVSVDCRNLNENQEISGTLQSKTTGGYSLNYQNPIRVGYKVRRLTPTECERLQGLPDDYTAGGSDTQRYKALGNGMAQPCPDFVMEGIASVLNNA